jgi:alpha-amylase/alpha-mannosidase (GH57 family)
MPSPERYVCIHGHFYQPPRENPWLEAVETQGSAAPYHDWNERITAECYAPNGAARIVNGQNKIIRILNNYGRISFNFGPTLLSWLKDNAHRVYQMILEADVKSQRRFGGHGSAMAQVYNHVIMPLASTRDKITQIRWGIADFESRFGRKPEGMWLAETAVDLETLDIMAAHGLRFVILAPHQCARVRKLESVKATKGARGKSAKQAAKDNVAAAVADPAPSSPDGLSAPAADPLADAAIEPSWKETPNASVDTTRSYAVKLKEGRSIAAFFYDGPRSRAIAFEGLLNDGETFARRLLSGFSEKCDHAQLVHVATDGESYGHHHHYGEMALAWALKWLEEQGHVKLTNYGEFLEKFPPAYEAEIYEDTSWSCAHGIERWRSDCGCNSGRPGWNQQWRGPLRDSLDWLRDTVAPLVRERGGELFKDVDEACNAYISVVLDRSPENIDAFFAVHASHDLNAAERVVALELMELERHAQLMYTSCGWFFDEISGIETTQVIAYAARVLQLAQVLFGDDAGELEAEFLRQLRAAKSNIAEQQNGASVYERYVKSMQVGLEQVGAHYAISSVFTSYPDQTDLFCYTVRRLEYGVETSGRGRLAIGKGHVCSKITEEQETVVFAVLHFGDQNISAAVKSHKPEEEGLYEEFARAARAAVIRADFPEVIRGFDRYFDGTTYSIQSLFRDEQQRIMELILKPRLQRVEASLASIYEDQASLLHFLGTTGLRRPAALTLAATFAINAGLRRALESNPIDAVQMRVYLGLAETDHVELDRPQLNYIADQQMKRAMVQLQEELATSGEQQTAALENALFIARTVSELPFERNLWQAQNIWYQIYLRLYPAIKAKTTTNGARASKANGKPESESESARADEWVAKFKEIGQLMSISVDDLVIEEETPILETASQPG